MDESCVFLVNLHKLLVSFVPHAGLWVCSHSNEVGYTLQRKPSSGFILILLSIFLRCNHLFQVNIPAQDGWDPDWVWGLWHWEQSAVHWTDYEKTPPTPVLDTVAWWSCSSLMKCLPFPSNPPVWTASSLQKRKVLLKHSTYMPGFHTDNFNQKTLH